MRGNNFDVISHTKGSIIDHNGVSWRRQGDGINSEWPREKQEILFESHSFKWHI